MEVLHVIWSAEIGGIEILVRDLSAHQINSDSTSPSVLICKPEGTLLQSYSASHFKVYRGDMRSGYDLSPNKIYKFCKIFGDFDVVHLHTLNVALFIAAFLSGSGIIFTEHGVFGTGKSGFKRKVETFLKKIFIKFRVDHVTFISNFIKDQFQAIYGMLPRNYSVVPNGVMFKPVDTRSASTAKLKSNSDFIIGTVSRFVEFKRIDRLIKAFHIFSKRNVSTLLLVGDGPLMGNLEKLCDQFGLEERAILTGFRENPSEFMDAMDVCVFPSYHEPFGLVAVEALGMGKPVIVFSDGGGLVEIVNNFCSDDVVEDVRHCATRIEHYFLSRTNDIQDRESRKRYSQNFDINIMSHSFEKIYGLVINGS